MKEEWSKALNLPNILKIQKIENKDKEIIVHCRTKKVKVKCPDCGGRSVGYDTTRNRKRHTSLNGKKIFIQITKRRLECKKCKKVFTEKIEGMTHPRSTDFFTQLVQEKSRNQDYSSVGRELGISHVTVMKKQDLLALEKFIVPEEKEVYLGMDGKYLNGEEEIFVIGEIKKRQFLGVTKTNKASELEKVLEENIVKTGKIVKVITMDMSTLLKSVAGKLFPSAAIVVDKFHVIKHVNSVIDLCRIAVEKNVNQRFEIKRILLMKNETMRKLKNKPKWKDKIKKFLALLNTNSEIKILWDLKNRMQTFYKSKTPSIAQERFDGLIKFLDFNTAIHPEFKDLKKTFIRWQKEILAYFTHPFTNAFIEGLNNRIETLKRKKFGFRNKLRFIKTLVFALMPISFFIHDLIFTH